MKNFKQEIDDLIKNLDETLSSLRSWDPLVTPKEAQPTDFAKEATVPPPIEEPLSSPLVKARIALRLRSKRNSFLNKRSWRDDSSKVIDQRNNMLLKLIWQYTELVNHQIEVELLRMLTRYCDSASKSESFARCDNEKKVVEAVTHIKHNLIDEPPYEQHLEELKETCMFNDLDERKVLLLKIKHGTTIRAMINRLTLISGSLEKLMLDMSAPKHRNDSLLYT
jgi:hypothetical protein